jgi:hypothetical protein
MVATMPVAFRDYFPIILSGNLARITAFHRDQLGFTESYRFPDEQDGEPELSYSILARPSSLSARRAEPGCTGCPAVRTTAGG